MAKDEGEELAKQNHAAWVETSAKTNTNVGKYSLLLLALGYSDRVRSQGIRALFGGDREAVPQRQQGRASSLEVHDPVNSP